MLQGLRRGNEEKHVVHGWHIEKLQHVCGFSNQTTVSLFKKSKFRSAPGTRKERGVVPAATAALIPTGQVCVCSAGSQLLGEASEGPCPHPLTPLILMT